MSIQGFEIPNHSQGNSSNCMRSFERSKFAHRTLYFIGTCLAKFAAFTTFCAIYNQMMDDFRDRPKYISVCQYVVSEELNLKVDRNCKLFLNQEEFTCNTEYGSNPTTKESDEVSEYIIRPAYSAYGDSEIGDSGYNNSNLDNSKYDGGESGYGDGFIDYSSSENRTYTTSFGIEQKASEYLEPVTDGFRSTVAADKVREFVNSAEYYDMVEFFFIFWILANVVFRLVRACLKFTEITNFPCYTGGDKFKIIFYENLIEACISTSIYPVTYLKYGDCFECPLDFMCDFGFYLFTAIGFIFTILSIFLTMCECGKKLYCKLICFLCSQDENEVNQDDDPRARREREDKESFRSLCSLFLGFSMITFTIAFIVTNFLSIITIVYSSIQHIISIIYYTALLANKAVNNLEAPLRIISA